MCDEQMIGGGYNNDEVVTEEKDRKNGLYGPEYEGENF